MRVNVSPTVKLSRHHRYSAAVLWRERSCIIYHKSLCRCFSLRSAAVRACANKRSCKSFRRTRLLLEQGAAVVPAQQKQTFSFLDVGTITASGAMRAQRVLARLNSRVLWDRQHSVGESASMGADVSYLHGHFDILLCVHVHYIEKPAGADTHAHVVHSKVARRNPAKAGKLSNRWDLFILLIMNFKGRFT